MQRISNLTSATVRRLVLALALLAPIAISAPAWAQDQTAAPAAPAATAPAPAVAAPAAAPEAAATGESAEPKQLANDLSVVGMVKSATALVKVVMVLLGLLSVWSWAIMLDKAFTFAGLNRRADQFLGVFRSSSSLDDVYKKVADVKNNPLVSIFIAGMNELRVSLDPGMIPSDHLREHVEERVSTAMEMVEGREAERLGFGMGVLATVGSTSPFIGLFGTVYGIMDAFLGIANSGTTNLAVVAPGIAEALLTTAIGLFAAIPAVMMYNFFARKIGAYNGRMNNFIGEFSTVLSRHLDRKG